MAKKKILYLITKSNWGGAQKYVFDLATSLPENDFEAVVALGGNGELKKKLENAQVRVISIKHLERDISLLKEAASLFEIYKILKKENPDIVHVNSSKTGGLGAFAARLAGVPKIVFTAHGWPFKEDRSFLTTVLIKFFSWLTAIFAHITIAVSENDYRLGKKMPLVSGKMRLIHNGIQTPSFLSREEARRSLSIDAASPFVIGSIGELHKNKGHFFALEAISSSLDKPLFVLMGTGEEKEIIEKQAKELGIAHRVLLRGFVPNGSSLLKAFDALLFPSVKEGLPYVVIEAGFAELPVIASDVGGIPEIIERGKEGLLVPPKNPQAIADALVHYRSNPEIAREHGLALKKKVEGKFSLRRMIEETIKIYS